LLTLLPAPDFRRLTEAAEQVRLPLRTVVGEPGEPIRHVHFPLTCVISTVVPMQDGAAVEAATVGNEGMSGIDLLVGGRASLYRTMQQVEGESLRIPAEHFRAVLSGSEAFRRLLERYILTMTHQAGQTAACNLRHAVEQRMCRWLLMTHDRVCDDTFYLTHEVLSFMLGVRRQTISETAAILHKSKLITYRRGHMSILDRPGLEAASCECYQAVRDAYRQVMGVPDGACDDEK
ncbi:MAG: Crp/Fnr family transcriptional regulator, partial [Planctomycetaceae bacterium]